MTETSSSVQEPTLQGSVAPESGYRYIMVDYPGTQNLANTASLPDNTTLRVQAKDPNSSLSFVHDSEEDGQDVDFATVIIAPAKDENREIIPGKETLVTMHPGAPTTGCEVRTSVLLV